MKDGPPASFDWKAMRNVSVVQGDYKTSNDATVMFSTILGSCVAACVYDEARGIGGMNHFLLPEAKKDGGTQKRYGAYAMEVLINDLLRQGARRDRLVAKLFGGSKMLAVPGAIGDANAKFATDYLNAESITCAVTSFGGTLARRIHFHPVSGRARQFMLPAEQSETILVEDTRPAKPAAKEIVFF